MLDAFARLLGWLAAVGVFTLVALAGLALLADLIWHLWRAWRPDPDERKAREINAALREAGQPEWDRVDPLRLSIHRGAMTRDWPDDCS